MMTKRILICLMALCSVARAWDTRVEFESAMIHALQDRTYLISDNFQTQLAAFIESPVDEYTRFEAQIIKADMNNALYRQNMDFDKLTAAYNASTNFFMQVNVFTNTWCAWGVRIAICGYYGNFGQPHDVLNLATNTVSEIIAGRLGADTNCISQAYLSRHDMANLTPLQAFQTIAIMSAAVLGDIETIASYTNNLPSRIINMLNEVSDN